MVLTTTSSSSDSFIIVINKHNGANYYHPRAQGSSTWDDFLSHPLLHFNATISVSDGCPVPCPCPLKQSSAPRLHSGNGEWTWMERLPCSDSSNNLIIASFSTNHHYPPPTNRPAVSIPLPPTPALLLSPPYSAAATVQWFQSILWISTARQQLLRAADVGKVEEGRSRKSLMEYYLNANLSDM